SILCLNMHYTQTVCLSLPISLFLFLSLFLSISLICLSSHSHTVCVCVCVYVCVFVCMQEVTPDNFLAVLKGDSASVKGGSGKVLKRQVLRDGEGGDAGV